MALDKNSSDQPNKTSPRLQWRNVTGGLNTRIVVPYLLLTLIVAGVGAYFFAFVISSRLTERFLNQLIDAGRVVSDQMVDYEEERLKTLRQVANTERVPDAVAAGDTEELNRWVPQLLLDGPNDVVEIIDRNGIELYGWQRSPFVNTDVAQTRSQTDFSNIPVIRQVLAGDSDQAGDKRIVVMDSESGLILFTVGPIYRNNKIVGAVMIGTYLDEMVARLTRASAARVTLYSADGTPIATSLGRLDSLPRVESAEAQFNALYPLLEASENPVVTVADADEGITLWVLQTLGQEYQLAFGDWRLRNQSVGWFSVALQRNFIYTSSVQSRYWVATLATLTTISVMIIGLLVTRPPTTNGEPAYRHHR